MNCPSVVIAILLISTASIAASVGPAEDAKTSLIEQLLRLSTLEVEEPDWWETLAEIDRDVEPMGPDALMLLGSLFDDISGVRFSSCDLAIAISYVGRRYPDDAVRVLVEALPGPERSDDLCIANGMVFLGPDGFPAVIDCAKDLEAEKAYVCVLALLTPIRELPDAIDAVGLLTSEGEMLELPSRTRGLRRIARRWESWWLDSQGDLHWDPETRTLQRRGETSGSLTTR